MAFVDQGEFETMKTLSGRRAPRCDKHQFRAVSAWTVFELLLFKQACKQASKRASKRASKQARKQASAQASKQASKQWHFC